MLYLRERSWPAYFYEKLFASAGRIASIEADVRREIEGAFSPLIHPGRAGAGTDAVLSCIDGMTFRERRDQLLSLASENRDAQPRAYVKMRSGLSVSDCSPIDVTCSFAIVNATFYGSKATGSIMDWESAKQAFGTAWDARKRRSLPIHVEEKDKAGIRFSTHKLNTNDDKLDLRSEVLMQRSGVAFMEEDDMQLPLALT